MMSHCDSPLILPSKENRHSHKFLGVEDGGRGGGGVEGGGSLAASRCSISRFSPLAEDTSVSIAMMISSPLRSRKAACRSVMAARWARAQAQRCATARSLVYMAYSICASTLPEILSSSRFSVFWTQSRDACRVWVQGLGAYATDTHYAAYESDVNLRLSWGC